MFFESRVAVFNCNYEFIISPGYIPVFGYPYDLGTNSDAASIICWLKLLIIVSRYLSMARLGNSEKL